MARERALTYVHRVGEHLVAEAPLDGELIRRFPANTRLRAVVTMPRNVGKHRLYWAMLAIIRENVEGSPSVEKLHKIIKAKLGYTISVRTKRGPHEDLIIRLAQAAKVMEGVSPALAADIRDAASRLRIVTIPASISFEEMGEDEFSTYFEDFVKLVLVEIIPGIGRQAFERQAMEMIAGPDYDGPRRLEGPKT